jgi:hypothetical protein
VFLFDLFHYPRVDTGDDSGSAACYNICMCSSGDRVSHPEHHRTFSVIDVNVKFVADTAHCLKIASSSFAVTYSQENIHEDV